LPSIPSSQSKDTIAGWLAAVLGVCLATAVLFSLSSWHINHTTVALVWLLVVLLVAMRYGSRPAIAAAVLAMLCFNFFFLPPVGTLTIVDPQNWIALGVFLITAITVGQLSARARRRAEEAETKQREIERLYRDKANQRGSNELGNGFIARRFGATAVLSGVRAAAAGEVLR
jgi:two-component system sensor histidine kinase KdpD